MCIITRAARRRIKMKVLFKRIDDFPEYYITNIGTAYSRISKYNPQGRIKRLKTQIAPNGYKILKLRKNSKQYTMGVHRLVAEAFILNSDNKPQVNHIDGNKTNNMVNNLEWATGKENAQHSFYVLGNNKVKYLYKNKKGKNHPFSRPVLQIKDNIVINEFEGILDAQRKTGIKAPSISFCCNEKRKSAGGYQWKYKQQGEQK